MKAGMDMPDKVMAGHYAWVCGCSPEGVLEYSHPGVGVFHEVEVAVTLQGERLLPFRYETGEGEYRFYYRGGLRVTLKLVVEGSRLTLAHVLSNDGSDVLEVGDVELLNARADLLPTYSCAYLNGRTMVDPTGLVPLCGEHSSNSVLAFTDKRGAGAFALGAIRPDDAWYDFSFTADEDGVGCLRATCCLEGSELAAGATRVLSPVRLYVGHSMARLLARYAEDLAEWMIPLSRVQQAPSGWCSWYHYYGTDTSSDIRKNMQAIRTLGLAEHLRVIQIDDGWNRAKAGAPRCWGDWMPGGKYPEGMGVLVDDIHASGFQAGLWLAPFSVDGESNLYKEHPDWLVKGEGEQRGLDPLAGADGVFALDLTHPRVQEFVRQTFRRVFQEWRFDYVKIDFLAHGAARGKRFDRRKTGIEAFRIGMDIIREEAGQRFVLNCSSPMTAAVGLCDGMRVGMDVGGRWFAPMNLNEWPYGNCCIKAAAISALWRQWMHRAWWHNDPDCIVVRSSPVPEELKKFINNPLQNRQVEADEFGLTDEEAACWARLVWFSGGMWILSEDLTTVPGGKWRLLDAMKEPNRQPVCWIDYYESAEIAALRTAGAGPLMIGLFNLSDSTRELSFEADRLGLGKQWHFVERLSGESFGGTGATVCFPPLPHHSGRIWELSSDT